MATIEGPSMFLNSSSSTSGSSSSSSAPSSPNTEIPHSKKGLTFDDLAKYFHLPITQVSKELGICATVLKKICRRNGIHRWPHRKIKSIDRMVEMLESSLDGRNTEEQLRLRREIDAMKRKKSNLLKNPHSLESTQRLVYNIPTKMMKKPGSPTLPRKHEPFTPTHFDLKNLPPSFNFSGIPRAPSPTELTEKVTKEKLQETLSSILQRNEKDGKVLQEPALLKNIIERLAEEQQPSSMVIDSESSDSISEIASNMKNTKIHPEPPKIPSARVVPSTVTSSASTSFTASTNNINKIPDGSSNSVSFASLLQKQQKSKQNDSLITQALNNQLIKNFVKFQPIAVVPSDVATKDLPLERPVVVSATVLPDAGSTVLPSLRSWHSEEDLKESKPLPFVELPKLQLNGPKIPILEPDPTKYSLQKAKPVAKPAEHATSSS